MIEADTRNLPVLLSPKEVQKYLGCNTNKIYALIKSQSFPSIRIGGRYYILQDKFIDWINAQQKNK